MKMELKENINSYIILHKRDFQLKKKTVAGDREGHYIMIKQSIHQKDRTTENIHTFNTGESKQIKQILTGVRIPDHLTYLLGIPEHLTCLLRNLYAGQEATLRTGHGTTHWFKIGKGLHQACILLPCLFNLYSECMLSHFSHV